MTARELLAAHTARLAEWERQPNRDIADIPQRPWTTWRNCETCGRIVHTLVDVTPLCPAHESEAA